MRAFQAGLVLLFTSLLPSLAVADTYNLSVAFDRWMYPFSITPGDRAAGSTFAAFDEVDFDQRDAQVLVGFDTSSIGGLAPNQIVTSAVVTFSISANNGFEYDPTYDDYTTYDGSDPDTGRPVELYGVGTRDGYVGLTIDDESADPTLFKENSLFGSSSETFKETRYAFASDYHDGIARDISNNEANSFNPDVWAVGQIDSLSPGALVPMNSAMAFDLDLNNNNLVDYLNGGVDSGELFFAISSLHPAALGGPVTYPSFYLDAGGSSLGPTATLDLTIIDVLPADTDKDGDVDTADLTTMFQNFTGAVGAAGGKTMADGDTDMDGDVDTGDLTAGFQQFTGAQSAGLAAVPEPGSLLLLALGAVGLLVWPRRRRARPLESEK